MTSTTIHLANAQEQPMTIRSCIPVIPSADIERSLRLWVDGLGFTVYQEMRANDLLVLVMLRQDEMHFMLNRRVGTPVAPDDYEGIRLYWAPSDLDATRQRLLDLGFAVSAIERREYDQLEFFLTDDDGFTHCFGVAAV
jgi:hypothetical protein